MQEKEKTIREWLKELPEPYKTQAINNSTEERLNKVEPDLLHALVFAFNLSDAPEGTHYWRELFQDLYIKTNNPEEYEIRMTAKKLLNIGNKAKEYLLSKISAEEFAQYLENEKKEFKLWKL